MRARGEASPPNKSAFSSGEEMDSSLPRRRSAIGSFKMGFFFCDSIARPRSVSIAVLDTFVSFMGGTSCINHNCSMRFLRLGLN